MQTILTIIAAVIVAGIYVLMIYQFIKNKMWIIPMLLIIFLVSCKKEHDQYRFTPALHKGQLVQFEKSIEHDYMDSLGNRLWNIPQPFTIDTFYYNDLWRDNWYYVKLPDGSAYGSAIDELSLQRWTGKLQK